MTITPEDVEKFCGNLQKSLLEALRNDCSISFNIKHDLKNEDFLPHTMDSTEVRCMGWEYRILIGRLVLLKDRQRREGK